MLTENIINLINGLLISPNGWLIRQNESPMDIEICNGKATVDNSTRTCALCVALNRTIFKANNKPNYNHPYCKCSFKEVYLNKITIDFPVRKITEYLFKEINKYAMMRSMGYDKEDGAIVYSKVYDVVEKEFLKGNYILKNLNINGQHIEIPFVLKGKAYSIGKRYNCHAGCVVWPNGKIRVVSPLILDKEII